MSSTLYWKPANPPPPPMGSAKMPLKTLIVRRFWDTEADGSLCYHDPKIMTVKNDAQWLLGIVEADRAGLTESAKQLLADLIKYGTLEITVEG